MGNPWRRVLVGTLALVGAWVLCRILFPPVERVDEESDGEATEDGKGRDADDGAETPEEDPPRQA